MIILIGSKTSYILETIIFQIIWTFLTVVKNPLKFIAEYEFLFLSSLLLFVAKKEKFPDSM